jgi:hypothetical protein
MGYRPLFMFPALAVAFGGVLLFFNLRGRATRPDVPVLVSSTVEHFAPGVTLGSSVKASSAQLRGVTWVPDVGYVGTIAKGREFEQVRMFLRADERAKPRATEDALIESVELVSTKTDQYVKGKVLSDLGIHFRGPAKEGCIMPVYEDAPYRQVYYWTTREDRGGVAYLQDWTVRQSRHPGLVVWSIIAWSGPFKGTETLLANFEKRKCLDVAGR